MFSSFEHSVRPSVHPSGQASRAHRAFPPGLQQAVFSGVGRGRPLVHWGFSPRDTPQEGIFHFPALPPGISPLPHTVCCPQSVPLLCLVGPTHVPNMIAHCVLSRPQVSLNMPSLLCLLTDQCCHNTPHPVPVIRIVFKGTYFLLVQTTHCLITSCPVPDTSALSSRGPDPSVCPPGRSRVSRRLHLLLLVSGVSPFRTRSIYLPRKELGQRSTRGQRCPQQPWREAEDRQLPRSRGLGPLRGEPASLGS